MAKLKVYTDRGVRSVVAKQYLTNLGVPFDEINLEQQPEAVEFLNSKNRETKRYPLPQFYVGEAVAWENGFKDIAHATQIEINERINQLDAS